MARVSGGLQQQTVLWEGTLQHKCYGEVTHEVAFAQPVLVSSIRVSSASTDASLQFMPQLLKGHAADLQTPTAARFSLLFDVVSVPWQGMQELCADKAFPTQRVWLRGRFNSVKVQLLGYELGKAPQQIQEAAHARFGLLPAASPLLSLPCAQQPQQSRSTKHAPSLPRPAGKQLPLGKIPPAFVLTLAPLAQYWSEAQRQKSDKIPLPPGSGPPPAADLCACDSMAKAVLAAQRGSPAALQAKLASTRNEKRLAVDWDAIRDSVLDMATYCCSALADSLVDPADVGLGTAGVSAAIMLAACQDAAAQFLSWPNGGIGVAGAIAVRDLVSMPSQPGPWQERSMGLVELLLESCPTIAGPTLQGTLNPAGIPEPQDQDRDASAAAEASAGAEDSDLMHDSEGAQDGGSTMQDAAGRGPGVLANGHEGPGAVGSGSAVVGCTAMPAAKRQRVAGCADAPADSTNFEQAADGAADAALGSAGLLHAESTTGTAAAAALTGAQQPQQPPPAAAEQHQQQQQQQPRRSSEDDNGENSDDALLAGLEEGSDSLDGPGDDPAADRRKRRKQGQEDLGGLGADIPDGTEPMASEHWDLEDHEGVTSGDQQDVGSSVQQQQDVALEEGDYPEADEDAIRAEAAAKAARRCVGRRRPVCALAEGQLYSAIVQLAMTPMKRAAAVSCTSVLRRLRAYRCLDMLQATVGAWLSNKVDALVLTPAELCEQVRQVAVAAQDLAALVLLPPPSDRSLFLQEDPEWQPASSSLLQRQQQQEADYCVLQLLLSFRALELLAAVNCYVGVHTARLAALQQHHRQQVPLQQPPDEQQGSTQFLQPEQQPQQQPGETRQQPAPEQPLEPPDPQSAQQATQQQVQIELAKQQEQLCREHAQLLASIRALISALTASSGGWSFLTAAREGLAALATAVCPTRQVCLDGGPFGPNTSLPYDPQQGWAAERTALLATAAGLGGTSEEGSASAGNLSDSLQRLWLLVEGTAQLQGAADVLSGKIRMAGAVDKLNAAMKTLFVVGFASEFGRQSLVSALSACNPAVRQLGVLLEHHSQVLSAAGTAPDDQGLGSPGQDRPLNMSVGTRLVYGALYAPELLLALVLSPHLDATAAWLPQTAFLHDIVREQLHQHDVSAPAAAAAAFPDLASGAAALRACGLRSALLPGGSAAAKESCEQVLLQLHGAVLTAHNLLQHWQEGNSWDLVGAGSAGKLLDWLHSQLPKLESVVQRSSGVIDPEGVALMLPATASEGMISQRAADSTSQLDGAAAAAGAPPPAGRDVKSEAVVEFMRSPACRSATLCALHLVDMLLHGAPDSVRRMARKAKGGSSTTRPAFMPVRQHGGSVGPGDASDAAGASSGSGTQQYDGFATPEVVRELLEGVAVKSNPSGDFAQVGVFELLERALRTATVALRSADADLLWTVRSGSQEDLLLLLEARTAAAALMRAASTTTANLLVHLSYADPQHETQTLAVENDSLLDALVCAHSAVVTCREGLQACVPHPQLAPFVTGAFDPSLTPKQRSAADAALSSAAARVGNSRVLLLLEARQALAVCLRCWQLQGWRPDPVGALLGVLPHASKALETFAREDAAARKVGDPLAPPPPAPRQGPRQLLSSLLGLADLCPDEWPARGASQAAARHRDAAAVASSADDGGLFEGSPFERPSLILLRQKVAASLEANWDKLERLMNFGLSCSTRLARLALVRMLTRIAGLGAGMAPLLGPKVLLVVCERMHELQQLRKGLADRLHDISSLPAADGQIAQQHAAHKQALIQTEVNNLHMQLLRAAQVCEVLLPLCAAPAVKSVLLEHKAAGILSKALYAVVTPLPDLQQHLADEAAAAGAGNGVNGGGSAVAGPALRRVDVEVQALSGLLLQLVGVLMDPDISMNPWADRSAREMQDTPSIFSSSIAVAWLLAAAPQLSPANMATLAQLLVSNNPPCRPLNGTSMPAAAVGSAQHVPPSTAGASAGAACLMRYPKGRAVLLRVGRQWKLLDSSLREAREQAGGRRLSGSLKAASEQHENAQPATGTALTQAELQASAVWAADALQATLYAAGPDASHTASCASIAHALRDLAGSSAACEAAWQEHEGVVQAGQEMTPQLTWIQFVEAAKRAAASHKPSAPQQQSIAALLSTPPLLLACDAASLSFWDASAAAAHRAATSPPPATYHDRHRTAQYVVSPSSWWPRPQLSGGLNRGARSQVVEEVVELVQEEQHRNRQQVEAIGRAEAGGDGAGGGFIPAVYAHRGPQFLKDDQSTRKASMHVDIYQRKAAAGTLQPQQLPPQPQPQQHQGMPPPPPRPPAAAGTGSNVLKPGQLPVPPICDLCGEDGHIMRECPNRDRRGPGDDPPGPPWGGPPGPPGPPWGGPPGPPRGPGPGPSSSRDWSRRGPPGLPPGGSTSICYHCNEVGHFARECPSLGGPLPCYNCGEMGHFARECPRGDICHICGEVGHKMKDCPNSKRKGGGKRGPQQLQLMPSRGSGTGRRVSPLASPHQLSPHDSGSGSLASPPVDPRLRLRQSQDQQQQQQDPAAAAAGGGGGEVQGRGRAADRAAAAAAGADAGGVFLPEGTGDRDSAELLGGLERDASEEALGPTNAADGDGGGGEFAGEGEGDAADGEAYDVGGFLDDLIGGGTQEDFEGEGSDGDGQQYGVSEAGGL